MRAAAPVLLLLLAGAVSARRAMPTKFPNSHVWGCYNISSEYPFCDSTRPIKVRVTDLLSRLTDTEKLQLMSPDLKTGVDSCTMMDGGVSRLGIPPYLNLVEMNTGVSSCCLNDGQCVNAFAGPTGLGASFNTSMWRLKGEVLATEFRALNNINWYRCVWADQPNKVGLTGYGPNINIMRDPRWGRNSEVPSEDPFLAGEYAVHYVRGGQEGEDMRYTKIAMSLKHFAAYSVEENRASFEPKVSMHDLWETFLSGFERGMQADGGNATGVMCSYSAPNGVPSCADDYLLNKVLRGSFGRPDAVVATDCGAIQNMVDGNHYASSKLDAASVALFGGTDLEFGDTLWTQKEFGGDGLLEQLLRQNRSTVLPALDKVLTRVLTTRFKTGMFDDIADQPYTKIGSEAINSTAHWKTNLDATLQSLVLLKNANSTLPLTATNAAKWTPAKSKINLSLIGPHLDSQRGLLSSYPGDQICFDGTYDCIMTIRDFFQTHVLKEQNPFVSSLHIEKGVDIKSNDTSGVGRALLAASNSDVVVFFGGLNQSIEGESGDRTTVTLPGLQSDLLDEILRLPNNPRVVIVLINGGAVSLGANVISKADAIVEAFYPALRGAEALYRTIFGESNAWGRLPYTMYTAETVAALNMTSFDMSLAPGRTYKYLTQTPEFAFGHGLSYTTFSLSQCTSDSVVVKNTGTMAGAAVVMMFARPGADVRATVGTKHPVPLKFLIGFDRVNLAVGASDTLVLTGQRYSSLEESLKLYNEDGVRVWVAGTYYLDFFDGQNTCTYTFQL
eukprot:TRINITY_DN551_c0_g2_i1.p1 TRINITY_DN551_c0_g2~~TRINITY_DN551_c0_g2_i1.p1  ORF type:complete len:785 (+),score=247.55 TRINITY_DN551_c0_g2_i1:81-2435(+)